MIIATLALTYKATESTIKWHRIKNKIGMTGTTTGDEDDETDFEEEADHSFQDEIVSDFIKENVPKKCGLYTRATYCVDNTTQS